MSIRVDIACRDGVKVGSTFDLPLQETIDLVVSSLKDPNGTLTVTGSPKTFTLPSRHIIAVTYTEVSD